VFKFTCFCTINLKPSYVLTEPACNAFLKFSYCIGVFILFLFCSTAASAYNSKMLTLEKLAQLSKLFQMYLLNQAGRRINIEVVVVLFLIARRERELLHTSESALNRTKAKHFRQSVAVQSKMQKHTGPIWKVCASQAVHESRTNRTRSTAAAPTSLYVQSRMYVLTSAITFIDRAPKGQMMFKM